MPTRLTSWLVRTSGFTGSRTASLRANWARGIGVAFQQIQKYERGANRVGAARIAQIAGVLGVPVTSLLESTSSADDARIEDSARVLLTDRQSLRLLEAFDKISNDAARAAIAGLVDVIAPPRKGRLRVRF